MYHVDRKLVNQPVLGNGRWLVSNSTASRLCTVRTVRDAQDDLICSWLDGNFSPHLTVVCCQVFSLLRPPAQKLSGMAEPIGILIRGGRVVNEECSVISDVYIENGKIVDVGPNLPVPPRVRVIDATDKLVIPGGIDTHTHMELAFMGTKAVDDFHLGTKVRGFQK